MQNYSNYLRVKHIDMRVFLFFLFLGLLSCGQLDNKLTKVKVYSEYISEKIEYRDSLFVLHTIKEWGKHNWYTFSDYSRMYKMTNSQIEYFIGGTFYSPDKKKILVWVGEKLPNANTIKVYNPDSAINRICPNGRDTIFNLSALIGFRENENSSWKLYPFDQQQVVCSETKEIAINILCQYYFEEMKNHEMYRMIQSGERKGHKELEVYGYNLQDKGFWNDCWLWKKDTVGSYGLYPFQIKGYNYQGDRCAKECAKPFVLPKVQYPPKIINLYR